MLNPSELEGGFRLGRLLCLASLLALPACSDRGPLQTDAASDYGAGGQAGGVGAGGHGGQTTGGGGSAGGSNADAAPDGAGLLANGASCANGGECTSGNCSLDGVCCDEQCTGICMTCLGTASSSPGTCAPADPNTDPRNECSDSPPCGTNGYCNGAGACRFYPAGLSCGGAMCDSATSLVPSYNCNGTGACVAAASQSCGGYLCSSATCGTTCNADSQCASSHFCSASTCIGTVNLAGNGDVETGTATGWSEFGGGGTLMVSSTAHGGTYSILSTGRGQYYQGPGYSLPTGPGKYNITAWAMQNDSATVQVVLQAAVECQTAAAVTHPIFGTTLYALPQGTWTKITDSVDFSTIASCFPTAAVPGDVRSAILYLDQYPNPGVGSTLVDLYLDDLSVTVTDGHNLVGNPNFEAGATSGWSTNGGGALSISTTVFLGGGHSLAHTARTATFQGPRWDLPIGAAKYNVTFNVRQAGTTVHDLALQPTYTCLGGVAQLPPAIVTDAAVGPNTWSRLTGTMTMPPADAPPGCKLSTAAVYLRQESGTCGTGAGQIECPDLFVDDVSITLAP